MGSGYFEFENSDTYGKNEHYYAYYYDEFDLDLGYPTSGMIRLSDKRYVRFFDKGMVLLNNSPDPQTFTDGELKTLEGYTGPYWRFIGGQDRGHNTGEAFNSITLRSWTYTDWEDRKIVFGDAIFLVTQPLTYHISDIIIDDQDFGGTSPASESANFWGESDWKPIYEPGKSYRVRASENWKMAAYHIAENPNITARYEPAIAVSGNYEVFEWHPKGTTSINYALSFLDGDSMVEGIIDQTKDEGQWNSLGEYYFIAGKANAMIIAGQDGIADAFRWEFKGE